MKIKMKLKVTIHSLSMKYASLSKQMVEHQQTHRKVFEELERIQTLRDGVELQIKEMARKQAMPGKTVLLVEEDAINVDVRSGFKAPTYNITKARRFWPGAIFDECRTIDIDSKIVADMIKGGKLDVRLAEKAQNEREETTPAVYVKLPK